MCGSSSGRIVSCGVGLPALHREKYAPNPSKESKVRQLQGNPDSSLERNRTQRTAPAAAGPLRHPPTSLTHPRRRSGVDGAPMNRVRRLHDRIMVLLPALPAPAILSTPSIPSQHPTPRPSQSPTRTGADIISRPAGRP